MKVKEESEKAGLKLNIQKNQIMASSPITSLVAQIVKCLPAILETQVRSLGWEDPLEKDMATPIQYSCLENPMDGGAWWAIYIVHGITESWTRLSNFTQYCKAIILQLKINKLKKKYLGCVTISPLPP